ncbi:MAG: hypothetical protein WC655_16955, partial [Candidatus Hydrogenedentales bacterium]
MLPLMDFNHFPKSLPQRLAAVNINANTHIQSSRINESPDAGAITAGCHLFALIRDWYTVVNWKGPNDGTGYRGR